jgi:hypothetical protein
MRTVADLDLSVNINPAISLKQFSIGFWTGNCGWGEKEIAD